MFYRRKIILAFLQLFGGELEKIKLQKLLFLLSESQPEKVYEFIPYKYGCYSFSAKADLITMVAKDFVIETEASFVKKGKLDYFNQLKSNDQKLLMNVKARYGSMDANALMKHTYINFPYWAINSVKAANILSTEQLHAVNLAKPVRTDTVLFTIGYEGISLEEYLNRLVRNDVKILVDVRNTPLSMKFGFSKSQLNKFCANLGIRYVHIPELGIQSDMRQELNEQRDYDNLFEKYKKNILTKTGSSQNVVLNLLKENKRIALTCFEANICQCHRKHLAEAIEKLKGFEYEVKHI